MNQTHANEYGGSKAIALWLAFIAANIASIGLMMLLVMW